jgi:peptidyl-prolyl cis-trans isomerase A (cyclophilin A)
MIQDVDVRIVTPLGNVSLRVFPARAPVTAGSFLKHVDAGQFAGAAFYRAVRHDNDHTQHPIQVVQGGLMDLKDFFEQLAHEPTHITGLQHVNGTVSAGRSELGNASAASFFICLGDQPALDFGGLRNPDGQGYAAFGFVVDGMDLIRRIHGLPTVTDAPNPRLVGQMLAEPVPFLSVARIAC